MATRHDGPASPQFRALPFKGNTPFEEIARADVSSTMRAAASYAPTGLCTAWGVPFDIRRALLVRDTPVSVSFRPTRTPWLVFLHTTDIEPLDSNASGFVHASRGASRLAEHVADYVVVYADGTEVRQPIRRRHQIGMLQRFWGECCFEAVAMRKPHPMAAVHEQDTPFAESLRTTYWGSSQVRARQRDMERWCNFLWAWQNPHPRRPISGLRVEPVGATIVLSALAAGSASSHPLRWERRRKALLRLAENERFDPRLDERGLLSQIQIDLGQVISAQPRFLYPDDRWMQTYDRQMAPLSASDILVEYTAHPDARFFLSNGRAVRVADLQRSRASGPLVPVTPATQRVRLRVVEKGSHQPVPVKLHVHGESGEYLPPVDRHRIPNPSWFEDYSTDYVASDPLTGKRHYATYISGETVIDLPLGRVFVEVSKGFEIQPLRKMMVIKRSTRSLTITLDRVLPWRQRGWVTADTHVHFLSPKTAQLEGSAEGVNVINLLASQWGELMTNVGDFDGKTTFGSREAGGDGEWLVRVGTENRQHVLGHISLLGYEGNMISPMCAGGPDEAALGDPVGILLSEWALECRQRGGLVVLPHFPSPRAENAAVLVRGGVDAVEMCSVMNEHAGIDPYCLSDWYRYLNCGYFYPAVGGTDKMTAMTAVGTIRTYARIPDGRPFDYGAWMDAVRAGNTFVTYGPLMEFRVEGYSPGATITMSRSGGSVDVEYELASVTIPMTRAELVVNGEIRESKRIDPRRASGHWSVKLDRSSWLALLVRAKRADRPEVIAAHSSPIMARLDGSRFFAAADAVTILEQIEGAMAYLDTIGTRAEAKAYKHMRLILSGAHRTLHNEMHRNGVDHPHTALHHHSEH